jgi:hypothetical protein
MNSRYPMGLVKKLSIALLCAASTYGNISTTSLRKIAHQSHGRMVVTRVGKAARVEYTLPPEVSEKFNDIMKDSTQDPYHNWQEYVGKAEAALRKVLPEDLTEVMLRMRRSRAPTVLIVHGMPIDNVIPETPRHGNRPHNKGYVSETTLLGICGLLRTKVDFDEREKDGMYINQIIPRDDAQSKEESSSFGSEIPFYPHTENVYSEPPLKFFELLCLRGDPKVATGVIFLDKILEYVKDNPPAGMSFEQFMEEIQKSQFVMRSGPSFGKNSGHAIQHTFGYC